MATPFNIPLRKYPRYRQEVTLDDTQYIIDISWNARGEFWFFDLYDRDQKPLLKGVKMVFGYDMLNQYNKSTLPSGSLVLLDPSGSFNRPDYENIKIFELAYISNE
jgi:hypothetical protein